MDKVDKNNQQDNDKASVPQQVEAQNHKCDTDTLAADSSKPHSLKKTTSNQDAGQCANQDAGQDSLVKNTSLQSKLSDPQDPASDTPQKSTEAPSTAEHASIKHAKQLSGLKAPTAEIQHSFDYVDKTKLRVVFLGGGSFGTAMANTAAKNGCDSTLWVRRKSAVKKMRKRRVNKRYLPDHKLHDALKFSSKLEKAILGKDIIFVAVPSHAFRDVLQKIAPLITSQAVVSLTKGIEKETFSLMSEIITQELPHVPFGVISGPNLAKEIMNNMPAGTVIASESEPLRHAVQAALHSALFRVFSSSDVLGVELGGALKNIYAIAMGMAAAYGVGENTKSMLITRALAEMSRFAVAMGASPLTFLGLSGVGDLFATCNSPLSRNYQIGNMLGKGYSLEKAVKKLGQTAEGVNTIAQVKVKSTELGIYMPITHALYDIIYEKKAPLGVALSLMQAGNRSDVEFVLPHNEA